MYLILRLAIVPEHVVDIRRAYFATVLSRKNPIIGSMMVEANWSPTAPPRRSAVPYTY